MDAKAFWSLVFGLHDTNYAAQRMLESTTPMTRQAARLGVEAADSMPIRQGFATTHGGLYRHPKTKTVKAQADGKFVTQPVQT